MEEKQKNKRYVLRKLFFASLYLSTFTFGGGYVIVTLLKEKFVDQYHWIDEEEMLDLTVISRSNHGKRSNCGGIQAWGNTGNAAVGSGGYYSANGDPVPDFLVL